MQSTVIHVNAIIKSAISPFCRVMVMEMMVVIKIVLWLEPS